MTVLVTGATGETGRRIVTELVRRQIPVRAMVRDEEKAKQILPSEAEIVVGDVLDRRSLTQAVQGCSMILCATGARPSFRIQEPYQVDYQGTKNLVDVAKTLGVERFVLVSSLCVSRFFHPLNLFWLILFWKKQAEAYLQNSGLIYTIVRPGGLKNEDSPNSLVMASEDTLFEGSIPRTKVAEVCVESLYQPTAANKIIEIVTQPEAEEKSLSDLFAQFC